MEETQTVQNTLPLPLNVNQPISAILEHLRLALDTKRAEQFGFVAKVAQQLATQEHISERSAFRLLQEVCANKPSRKVTTFLLVLQMLGYTTIHAGECSDIEKRFGNHEGQPQRTIHPLDNGRAVG